MSKLKVLILKYYNIFYYKGNHYYNKIIGKIYTIT